MIPLSPIDHKSKIENQLKKKSCHSAGCRDSFGLPSVEGEVDCADIGMPKTILVGLPEAAVKEGTYRIGCTHFWGRIENSGYFNPIHRTVINLAPADLPISLGLLIFIAVLVV